MERINRVISAQNIKRLFKSNAKALFVCGLMVSIVFSASYVQKDTSVSRLHEEYFHPLRNILSHEEKYDSFSNSVTEKGPLKCNLNGEDDIYTYGDKIFDSIGKTELQQYDHFKKHNRNFTFILNQVMNVAEQPATYNYHVTAVSSTDIIIEERNGNSPTGGGSNFLVRSDSVSKQICHYDDFFNGTYVVHCLLPECTCRNISIWLMYCNFTAYSSNYYPIRKLLWQSRMCNHGQGHGGMAFPRRKMTSSSDMNNIVTWYLKNRQWVPRLLSGKIHTQMSKSSLCTCVKKIRKLFLFGPSHMRYKTDYIITSCYELPPGLERKYTSVTVENVNFVNLSRMKQFATLWEKHMENKKLDRRDVVLIQTGAHDMSFSGIQYTMDEGVMSFVRALGDLQKKSAKYGFKLVVVTTPPYPPAWVHYSRGSRSMSTLAALNRRMKSELSLRNVTVFDEFSILLAEQDNNVCGCHYLCREANTTQITGTAGLLAVSMLMSNNVC